MTGTGFLMMSFGFLLGLIFGSPDEDEFNFADSMSMVLLLGGSALVSLGVGVFLLGAMP